MAEIRHIYEPDCLGHPYMEKINYTPDFLISKNMFPSQKYAIVEIKPKMPSKSYLDNLAFKVSKLKPYNLLETFQYVYGVRAVFHLVVFNPFDGILSVLGLAKHGRWYQESQESLQIKSDHVKGCYDTVIYKAFCRHNEAMDYRFDLEQPTEINPSIQNTINKHEPSFKELESMTKKCVAEFEEKKRAIKNNTALDYVHSCNRLEIYKRYFYNVDHFFVPIGDDPAIVLPIFVIEKMGEDIQSWIFGDLKRAFDDEILDKIIKCIDEQKRYNEKFKRN